jgi:hypothetical protein
LSPRDRIARFEEDVDKSRRALQQSRDAACWHTIRATEALGPGQLQRTCKADAAPARTCPGRCTDKVLLLPASVSS